ncbi:MAG: nucleoside triphosphate pyrophosphohydrolase [Anaerolineae bacterium]|nr:nucleoside triphosphate pyrophosphohydrolase [Candidatus Roseilinea sp.]MDW8450993.1 nucleoside triphosphate pyrophosphohydrolase [Anaerolineae bacterium]
MIIVLGLGPGDAKLLTREAWDVLGASARVYLRTRRHPAVAGLPPHLAVQDFDALYDGATSFDDVYARIAEAIIAVAQTTPGDVVYAVPGHPLVGEASVWLILRRARQLGIPTRIVSGLSFIEPTLEALSAEFFVLSSNPGLTASTQTSNLKPQTFDPLDGLQICDALEIAALHHPPLNPDKPALIAQVYSRAVASDVKLTLMNQYPPEHPVFVVRGGSSDGRKGKRAVPPCHLVALSQLDHADRFDHLTSLYVPPLAQPGGFESLQETIAHLRAPEGCPWDREQTHESLRSTLLEEAYEVLAAIDAGDLEALKEELGDLLLNVVLQAQIATEAEEFRMCDVIAAVDAKLRRRHPHVFGDVVVNDAGEVIANWNAIKQQEKAAKGEEEGSVLDGIAPALPALAQAQKMAHRAEKAGFRWNSHGDRLAKVREELEEAANARDDAHRAEEIGDLLFTIADWADGYGIDVETAAREANLKFARRFRALERIVRERGLTLSAMSQDEMLAIWREIKQSE